VAHKTGCFVLEGMGINRVRSSNGVNQNYQIMLITVTVIMLIMHLVGNVAKDLKNKIALLSALSI